MVHVYPLILLSGHWFPPHASCPTSLCFDGCMSCVVGAGEVTSYEIPTNNVNVVNSVIFYVRTTL